MPFSKHTKIQRVIFSRTNNVDANGHPSLINLLRLPILRSRTRSAKRMESPRPGLPLRLHPFKPLQVNFHTSNTSIFTTTFLFQTWEQRIYRSGGNGQSLLHRCAELEERECSHAGYDTAKHPERLESGATGVPQLGFSGNQQTE